MRRVLAIAFACLPWFAAGLCLGPVAPALRAQEKQVVDRILARVEDDIIALSEVRELAAYQQLMDGRSEALDRLLDELVEQWAINSEAQSADFPPPPSADVDDAVRQIQARFPNAQAYAQRLAALGLTPDLLRRIVERQIYLTRYIDYRFRPSVQADDDAIAKYYQEQLVPALKAKGQTVPPLEDVSGQIRDLLVTQGINDRSAAWLQDVKGRLRVNVELPVGAAANTP